MTIVRRKKPATILLGATLILITIFAAGCSNVRELEYTTNADQQKLLELKGKTLVILLYEYDDTLLVGSELLEPSVAQIVADDQKASFLSEFATLFHMKDVSNDPAVLGGRRPTIDNPKLIQEILEDMNADGGILITNGYGYELARGLLDGAADRFLKRILPEESLQKLVGFLSGPSPQVQAYYLASNAHIVDKEGRTAWNFYGKAYALREPLEPLEPSELVRSVLGLDPSQQRLIEALTLITRHYTQYSRWLIQMDLGGSPKKNYFTDYPEEQKAKHIGVFPASDESHVPHVKGKSDFAVTPGGGTFGLWELAKSGSWRKPGQWTQAWAALKLWLASFVLAIIFNALFRWAGEESCLGQLFLPLALAFSLALVVAIYYLLQAIL